MLVGKRGSYYEEYLRSRGVKGSDLDKDRLMTDRTAYISYLEVQLERVSAACMTAQGFSDRIEHMQRDLLTLQEKTVNMGKVVRLSQAYTEEQGEEASSTLRDFGATIEALRRQVGGAASTATDAERSAQASAQEAVAATKDVREQLRLLTAREAELRLLVTRGGERGETDRSRIESLEHRLSDLATAHERLLERHEGLHAEHAETRRRAELADAASARHAETLARHTEQLSTQGEGVARVQESLSTAREDRIRREEELATRVRVAESAMGEAAEGVRTESRSALHSLEARLTGLVEQRVGELAERDAGRAREADEGVRRDRDRVTRVEDAVQELRQGQEEIESRRRVDIADATRESEERLQALLSERAQANTRDASDAVRREAQQREADVDAIKERCDALEREVAEASRAASRQVEAQQARVMEALQAVQERVSGAADREEVHQLLRAMGEAARGRESELEARLAEAEAAHRRAAEERRALHTAITLASASAGAGGGGGGVSGGFGEGSGEMAVSGGGGAGSGILRGPLSDAEVVRQVRGELLRQVRAAKEALERSLESRLQEEFGKRDRDATRREEAAAAAQKRLERDVAEGTARMERSAQQTTRALEAVQQRTRELRSEHAEVQALARTVRRVAGAVGSDAMTAERAARTSVRASEGAVHSVSPGWGDAGAAAASSPARVHAEGGGGQWPQARHPLASPGGVTWADRPLWGPSSRGEASLSRSRGRQMGQKEEEEEEEEEENDDDDHDENDDDDDDYEEEEEGFESEEGPKRRTRATRAARSERARPAGAGRGRKGTGAATASGKGKRTVKKGLRRKPTTAVAARRKAATAEAPAPAPADEPGQGAEASASVPSHAPSSASRKPASKSAKKAQRSPPGAAASAGAAQPVTAAARRRRLAKLYRELTTLERETARKG